MTQEIKLRCEDFHHNYTGSILLQKKQNEMLEGISYIFQAESQVTFFLESLKIQLSLPHRLYILTTTGRINLNPAARGDLTTRRRARACTSAAITFFTHHRGYAH